MRRKSAPQTNTSQRGLSRQQDSVEKH